jgi:hypothetical protein
MRKTPKLTLTKETLRRLAGHHLKAAVGEAPTQWCSYTCESACDFCTN